MPVRTPWRRDLPGAVLTLVIWFFGSFVVRTIISISVGGTSIYGPLAAPIVLLIWLYVLAIAVLIGAALNAAVESVSPAAGDRGAERAPAAGSHQPGRPTRVPTNRSPPSAAHDRAPPRKIARRATGPSLAFPRPVRDASPRRTNAVAAVPPVLLGAR